MKKNKTEWLLERRRGIGGSDVAAIFGLSKWHSAVEIYNEKISETPPEEERNDILELSSFLEEFTAKKYAEQTGTTVRRKNIPLVHCDYDFIRGNIDREILGADKHSSVGILECKAVSTYNFKTIEMHGLPDDYIMQIQQYFLAGNGRYTWGAFAVLNRDTGRLLVFDVFPDAALIEEIKAKEVDFWTNHVIPRIPPEPEPMPECRIPEYNGTIEDMRSDETLNRLVANLAEYQELMHDASALVDSVKNEIAEHLEHHEAVECLGARIFYKASTRKSLDSSKLKKELPDVYAKYETETTTKRTLRVFSVNN